MRARFPSVLGPTSRTALSLASFSSWMVLLMSGTSFGGAVYLLLVAALVLFPWRALRRD